MPLDDECEWYRYHHLFAELLRARLQETQPDLVPSCIAGLQPGMSGVDTILKRYNMLWRLGTMPWPRR